MGNLSHAERQVIGNMERREERFLSEYATLSKNGTRRYPERSFDIRPSFSRDADRILHSFAFQRYIGRSHGLYITEEEFIRDRVTHLQLALRISRIIARALALNEDLVQAIGLGHDIGHVPFGREGEKRLSQEVRQQLGDNSFCFRQNVQALRLLEELEGRNYQGNGKKSLNLTAQVLDGIVCYRSNKPKQSITPHRKRTWADFDKEVEKIRSNKSAEILPMTLEGCLIRFINIIARLLRQRKDAIAFGILNREDFPDMLGASHTEIVNNLCLDIIENSRNKDEICCSTERFEQLMILGEFNKNYIHNNRMIKAQKDEIARVCHTLFIRLLKQVKNREEDSSIVRDHIKVLDNGNPQKSYYNTTRPEMIVIDYLSVC